MVFFDVSLDNFPVLLLAVTRDPLPGPTTQPEKNKSKKLREGRTLRGFPCR